MTTMQALRQNAWQSDATLSSMSRPTAGPGQVVVQVGAPEPATPTFT